jgi:hypothetical protein
VGGEAAGVAVFTEMVKNKVSDKAARHRINRQVSPVSRPTQWRSRVQEDCVTGYASCRYFVGVIFHRQWNLPPDSLIAHVAMPRCVFAPIATMVKSIAPRVAPKRPEPSNARRPGHAIRRRPKVACAMQHAPRDTAPGKK